MPSPFYKPSRATWYVEVNRVQYVLGKHPDGLPPPKKKRKEWDPPTGIADAYHRLMAQLQEQGQMTGPMASLAKMNHAQKARQICLDARDILGGNGLLLDYHVARHMTDMEVVHTYEGTDSIQSLIVGRDVTGISAFA